MEVIPLASLSTDQTPLVINCPLACLREDLTVLRVLWFPGTKLERPQTHNQNHNKQKLGLTLKDEPEKPNGLHGKAGEKA